MGGQPPTRVAEVCLAESLYFRIRALSFDAAALATRSVRNRIKTAFRLIIRKMKNSAERPDTAEPCFDLKDEPRIATVDSAILVHIGGPLACQRVNQPSLELKH